MGLAHKTSSSIPEIMDHNADENHSDTDAESHRKFWIGGLPNELWLCILDHLCPHCHPTPPLRAEAVFTPAHEVEDWTPAPPPFGSRDDLLAMSMTCRTFRDLAQKYVGHRVGPLTYRYGKFLEFQRTIQARSDLANGVREMSVCSKAKYRSILGYLTSIRTLNYSIMCCQSENPGGDWRLHSQHVPEVKFGGTTLVGQFKQLRNLRLAPQCTRCCFVDLTRGRLWLETLMKAAPELRDLSLYYFADFCFTPEEAIAPVKYFLQGHTSPYYSGLPDNKITRLHLVRPWFRYHTLEQLLSNLKHLREFGLSRTRRERLTINENKMMRPVDGHDVITLLEPLKWQLEVLDLDFDDYPESSSDLGRFRPVPSLAGFTALKSLSLGRRSIEPPVFDYPAALAAAGGDQQKTDELAKAFDDNAKDFLVDMLPRRSLKFLQIVGRFEKILYHAMGELARRKGSGEFPSLKRVRMLGDIRHNLNAGILWGRGWYQHLKRFVPKKYWERARVVVLSPYHDTMDMSNGVSFRKAGVLYQSVAVTWYVGAELDGEPNDGLMAVYLEPRYRSWHI